MEAVESKETQGENKCLSWTHFERLVRLLPAKTNLVVPKKITPWTPPLQRT